MSDKILSGKIALVTGGKQGIGYAIVHTLAQNGADVIINDIRISENDEIYQAAKELGSNAMCISADVSNEDDVIAMYEAVKAKYGKLDILVNNAGITDDAMSSKMTFAQWQRVININLTGIFLTSKYAKDLMKTDGGSIVNFSSLAGVKGNVGQANYTASKAGIIGLTKTLALEYARNNIRVNAIAPGVIESPMTDAIPSHIKEGMIARIPMQRMGTPYEIADLVKFLVSKESSYITSQLIHINGGLY